MNKIQIFSFKTSKLSKFNFFSATQFYDYKSLIKENYYENKSIQIDFSKLYIREDEFIDYLLLKYGYIKNSEYYFSIIIDEITKKIYDIDFFVFVHWLNLKIQNSNNQFNFYMYENEWEKYTIEYFCKNFKFIKFVL